MKPLLFLSLLALPFTAAAQSAHNAETAKQLDIFNSIYRELDMDYVDTLSAKKNVENAVLYMLDQLDPYTVYYPENETDQLRQMTTGKYAGIGSVISPRKDLNRCIIAAPYEGQPAAEAGLRRGDIIIAIDGQDVGTIDGQELSDYSSAISEKLRGQAGTTFNLRVQRRGTKGYLNFRITRRAIVLPSITCTAMAADSIGYIALDSYTENTARDIRRAIVSLKQQGATKLILDLRGNGGGLMGEAVNLVGLFIPRGKEVVATRGKVQENTQSFKTTADPLDLDMPLVVLTNGSTASAAEITAGALQDYDRAVVLGTRTYGKGLVQETHELPYNGVLKLTTAKYYIPSGRCIQAYKFEDGEPVLLPDSLAHEFHTAAGRTVRDGGGITPDVVVKGDTLPNLVAYLSASDQLADYCSNYRNTHETIAAPEDFRLTDAEYADFCAYLKAHNFTYDRRSRRLLDELRRVAVFEGYAETAKAELDALEKKLTPDEDVDYQLWEKQIRRLVESTIVANYYYDRGTVVYGLREDEDVQAAVSLLRDAPRYRQLLAPSTAR